jgi:molybdopterin converting factor small subunit
MTIVEQIKAELEAFNAKKQDLVEQLRKEFPAMFKELFEQSEVINSFTWRAYTTYFNDGDTCTFSVHCDYPDINGENIDDLEWYDWRYKYYAKGDQSYANLMTENPEINGKECEVLYNFIDILTSIPEDFMLDLFGDHVEVTLNRDGTINVESYTDHD